MVGHEGVTFGSGGLLVFGTGSFTSDTSTRTSLERSIAPVPYGYLVYGVNSRLALGIGGYVPYGLGLEWPLDFNGRFVSFDSSLKAFYLQPTVAYALTSSLSLTRELPSIATPDTASRPETLASMASTSACSASHCGPLV